jgi:hypothetical protein
VHVDGAEVIKTGEESLVSSDATLAGIASQLHQMTSTPTMSKFTSYDDFSTSVNRLVTTSSAMWARWIYCALVN